MTVSHITLYHGCYSSCHTIASFVTASSDPFVVWFRGIIAPHQINVDRNTVYLPQSATAPRLLQLHGGTQIGTGCDCVSGPFGCIIQWTN